jgi:hypothetical protein
VPADAAPPPPAEAGRPAARMDKVPSLNFGRINAAGGGGGGGGGGGAAGLMSTDGVPVMRAVRGDVTRREVFSVCV